MMNLPKSLMHQQVLYIERRVYIYSAVVPITINSYEGLFAVALANGCFVINKNHVVYERDGKRYSRDLTDSERYALND